MFCVIMNTVFWIFAAGIIVVFACLSYVIKTSNAIKAAENKVRELDSDVEAALTKRYDLLTKQYAAVKKYMTYESRTLFDAIKLRKGMTFAEKTEAEKIMRSASEHIDAVFEAYPELSASKNIEVLQNSCTNAEDHLQAARRLYNAGVTNYNNLCRQFPSSIIAAATGHREADYYKSELDKKSDVTFD